MAAAILKNNCAHFSHANTSTALGRNYRNCQKQKENAACLTRFFSAARGTVGGLNRRGYCMNVLLRVRSIQPDEGLFVRFMALLWSVESGSSFLIWTHQQRHVILLLRPAWRLYTSHAVLPDYTILNCLPTRYEPGRVQL